LLEIGGVILREVLLEVIRPESVVIGLQLPHRMLLSNVCSLRGLHSRVLDVFVFLRDLLLGLHRLEALQRLLGGAWPSELVAGLVLEF
jgi:hypothetical protein